MCGIKQVQSGPGMMNCDCGGVRKILTKQEKIEILNKYQKDLEQELAAVKETLKTLTLNG